jgi:hypothetical protein
LLERSGETKEALEIEYRQMLAKTRQERDGSPECHAQH